MEKVKVVSMNKGEVYITEPDLRISWFWPKKGAVVPVRMEDLQQALYRPGVEAMFTQGILYIEDMQAKIELGLEEEGTEKPTNIVPLTDKDKEALLKFKPMAEFKAALKQYSIDQIQEIFMYAVDNEIVDFHKSEYIKQNYGFDIATAVKNKVSAEED